MSKSVIEYLTEGDTKTIVDYKDWKITVDEYPRGWSGNATDDNGEKLTFRGGYFPSKEEAIEEFKTVVDNYVKAQD